MWTQNIKGKNKCVRRSDLCSAHMSAAPWPCPVSQLPMFPPCDSCSELWSKRSKDAWHLWTVSLIPLVFDLENSIRPHCPQSFPLWLCQGYICEICLEITSWPDLLPFLPSPSWFYERTLFTNHFLTNTCSWAYFWGTQPRTWKITYF